MPITLLLAAAITAGVLLIALGLWTQRQPDPPPDSPIRPITPPGATPAPAPTPPQPTLPQRALAQLTRHPDPLVAALQTVFWIVMLVGLVDHLRDVYDGTVAYLAWVVTIVPHEAGHLVCTPFGWLLTVAGGSIWQVVVYVLLAGYAGWFRGRRWLGLVFWMIAGHSLINLSVYIEDAAERDLPLIFGLDESHHDWGNLLTHYDALQHDDLIALIARSSGAVIVVAAALVGLVTAWWVPRLWRVPPPDADPDTHTPTTGAHDADRPARANDI